MSQFLALPNEIKLHIIDYIHPATIVSFAVACKAIVNLSHAALGKHKASWNNCHLHLGTYNGFQDEPEDNDFWQRRLGAQIHPLTFLDETMKDSGVRAYYITKLHLEKTYSFDGDSPDELAQKTFNEELHRVLDARGPDISRLIDESPFIAADRREEWRTALIDPDINRSADAYIGLLLPLLPNLQSVSVTDVSGQIQSVTEMVSLIGIANRDPSSTGYGRALTKLREIAVDRTDTELGESMEVYASFAALPSMRSLEGNMISWDDEEFEYPPELPPNWKSQIKKISMIMSSVSGAAFAGLVAPMEALERFTYHHAGAIIGDREHNATAIVSALREYASHSVQYLDLTVEDQDGLMDEEQQWIGSLKSFQKLRTVRLDHQAF